MQKSKGILKATPVNVERMYHHAKMALVELGGHDRTITLYDGDDWLYVRQSDEPNLFDRFALLVEHWTPQSASQITGNGWFNRPDDTLDNLAELTERLGAVLSEKTYLDATWKERQQEWKDENAPLLSRLATINEQEELVDAELRGAAERYYAAHPESKKLTSGVAITERTTPVYDEGELFAWALKHAPFLLKLDTARVTQYAMALASQATEKRNLLDHIRATTDIPLEVVERPTASVSAATLLASAQKFDPLDHLTPGDDVGNE